MRKLFLVFLFLLSLNAFSQKSLKIAVISDSHFMSSKIAQPSKSLEKFESTTDRKIEDLHAVLNQVFSNLQNYQPDLLLITGDLTNNGERESHLDFAAYLKTLANKGTRIFVVPGNHDVNVPNAKAYIGDTPYPTSNVLAKEFEQIYAPYGYANATQRDSASLSYLAEINDSTWLLAIDSNRYKEQTTTTISSGRILKETMRWSLEILKEAKSKGILVLGMMHHGLVEHMPYQSVFFPAYLIDNWESNAQLLADSGLKVIFTGHFHSNDITSLTSPKGNIIYDIETGSLAGYPFPYRLMTLQNNILKIETKFVASIPGKPNLNQEYQLKTEKTINRIAHSKIESMSLPIPPDMKDAVVDLIVKMQLLHMKGDEKLDKDMLQMIERLSNIIGDTNADFSSFELDFPPTDNSLEIAL